MPTCPEGVLFRGYGLVESTPPSNPGKFGQVSAYRDTKRDSIWFDQVPSFVEFVQLV
jgi:hypothetical protein